MHDAGFVAPPLLFFPALAARVYLPEVGDFNEVYPLLCRLLLPVGMMGILLAAMFSATMSMLSSDYNSLASVITNLGGTVERVEVCGIRENTFYAKLIIRQNGQVVEVDSRPSDAIALAVRLETPIFVAEEVLDEVCP